MYIIRANQKDYEVRVHTAKRMLQHGISEAMVIETMEHGTLIEQGHGLDLYEHQISHSDDHIIVRVIVDEEALAIVTVIDATNEQL